MQRALSFLRRALIPPALCIAASAWYVSTVHAQLQFTEVMYSPTGELDRWEWVEVRNTSATAIDLDGWIFDDDDGVPISMAAVSNIKAANGNTVIPAGGVAVLYAGSDLDFTPSRFTNAWGPGINLIPVNALSELTDGEIIALWPDRASYDADNAGELRTFTQAAVLLNYTSGFPAAAPGRSIAWNGVGSFSNGANWVASEVGALQARTSSMTSLVSVPINGADRGNPGVVPAGVAPTGLRITEVMYAPASPEPGWEWIEVLNNTGATIDFGSQMYVLHDDDGADFTAPNLTSGVLPQGGVAVLFNAEANTLDNLRAAWGSGINFIPVTAWGNGFANTGDTVALWSSIDDYNLDAAGTDRTTAHAAAVVNYDVMAPWPTNNERASIFLKNLGLDSALGASWVRSGTDGDTLGSSTATPVLGTIVDHSGGDVGSPGKVGASTGELLGDYNEDGKVDAADYTVWRDRLGTGGNLPNDASPGSITIEDYNYWKSHFGATGGSGAQTAIAVPEPMHLWAWAFLVAIIARNRPNRSTWSGTCSDGRNYLRRHRAKSNWAGSFWRYDLT
jgi:hypothetical protein